MLLFSLSAGPLLDRGRAGARALQPRNWVLRDGAHERASQNASGAALVDANQVDVAYDAVESFLSQGGEVVAFVFAGRRRYMRILWAYLLRDRRVGPGRGVLSRVVFSANTEDPEDLAFLAQLQASHPEFVSVRQPQRVVTQGSNNKDYCSLYALAPEDVQAGQPASEGEHRTLLIKLDDDILYVAPDAFRNLAGAKLLNPPWLFVSANVVNHPLLAHVHQRLGLFSDAEVGEMVASERALNASDLAYLPPTAEFGYSTFSSHGWQSAPHAQLQHLMLLHRLRTLGARGAAAAYDYRRWDFDAMGYATQRWSINAFAYFPEDLASLDEDACAAIDDEDYLTRQYPAVVQRHCVATANALMAHYAYYPQREGLDAETQVLERYQRLADE